LSVGQCLLLEGNVRCRWLYSLEVLTENGLVRHLKDRITGEVCLTEGIFVAFEGRLSPDPLSIGGVSELFSCFTAPEVTETYRILHEADQTIADTATRNVLDAASHTNDGQTVEFELERASQNSVTGDEMH